MSEYQDGRARGVFELGASIETILETYEKEARDLDTAKMSVMACMKKLEGYRTAVKKDLDDSKITIKEAEIGTVYITRCVETLNQLFLETEAKRLQAVGAFNAARHFVGQVKNVYDKERGLAEAQKEFEKDPIKDLKKRPVGTAPGNPLEEYKKSSENLIENDKNRSQKK